MNVNSEDNFCALSTDLDLRVVLWVLVVDRSRIDINQQFVNLPKHLVEIWDHNLKQKGVDSHRVGYLIELDH